MTQYTKIYPSGKTARLPITDKSGTKNMVIEIAITVDIIRQAFFDLQQLVYTCTQEDCIQCHNSKQPYLNQ